MLFLFRFDSYLDKTSSETILSMTLTLNDLDSEGHIIELYLNDQNFVINGYILMDIFALSCEEKTTTTEAHVINQI